MIIYNVTINIEDDVREEWLQWMKESHIPKVMKTGLFIENRICKLLSETEVGTTYAIQYTCKSMDDYTTYQQEHAPRLQQEHTQRYKDRFVAFRTLLEIV